MSETPSLEPNQAEPQPETILPGDSSPDDAQAATQAAEYPAGEGDSARGEFADEPAFLLHDQPPEEVREVQAASYSAAIDPQPPPVPRFRVDHVPSVGHCYPGEPVVLHTRVRVLQESPGLLLLVEIPRWLRVAETKGPPEAGVYALQVGEARDEMRWEISDTLAAGTTCAFEATVMVPALDHLVHALQGDEGAERDIVSRATASPLHHEGDVLPAPATQTAVVALRHKGSYLKYLPAVYERDPFMGRFLMLFESLWGPIDEQIDTLADYFDPMLTTLPMLKWLADRLDLKVDDELPVAVVRRLVAKAVPLYRRRGTRAGLQELLQIYTGGEVQIVERRANNLRLGKSARLGHGVALGVRNQPHTFTLYIKLPPIPDDPIAPQVSERQRIRRRERIHALVELEKPAHVTYTLDVDED